MSEWRWTDKHDWMPNHSVIYSSFPPKFLWTCRRCKEQVVMTCPPDRECKGLVD